MWVNTLSLDLSIFLSLSLSYSFLTIYGLVPHLSIHAFKYRLRSFTWWQVLYSDTYASFVCQQNAFGGDAPLPGGLESMKSPPWFNLTQEHLSQCAHLWITHTSWDYDLAVYPCSNSSTRTPPLKLIHLKINSFK